MSDRQGIKTSHLSQTMGPSVVSDKHDDSIEAIGLSERVALCLKSQGISTVRDLIGLSESDLLGFLNINQITNLPLDPQQQKEELYERVTAIGEVRRQLEDRGWSLRSDAVNRIGSKHSPKHIAENHALQNKLSIQIDAMPISVRAENCLKSQGVYYVGDLVKLRERDLLKMPNLGKTTMSELKGQLTELGLSLGMNIGEWSYVESGEKTDDVKVMSEAVILPSIFDGQTTIEEQLEALLGHTVKKLADRQVARMRFGWTGQHIPTLEELGRDTRLSGLEKEVTRERIRQIESRATRIIRNSARTPHLQPPKLLESIELLRKRTPISESELVPELQTAELTKLNLTYDVLENACKVLGIEWPFVSLGVYDKGQRVFTLVEDPESRENIKSMLAELPGIHKGFSYLNVDQVLGRIPKGLRQIPNLLETVITISPDYRWLDNEKNYFWKPPRTNFFKGNRALYICRRIFSVTDEISINDLTIGVSRNLRHGHPDLDTLKKYPLSEKLLTEMLRHTGLYNFEGNMVSKAPGVEFDDLNSTDVAVLCAVKGLGQVVNFSDFRHNAVQEGLTLPAATVATVQSPFLCRVSRGYYRLIVDVAQLHAIKVSTPIDRIDSEDDGEDDLQEHLSKELLFEVDARTLLVGKARLTEPVGNDGHWNLYGESGEKLGGCNIQGSKISEVKEVLEKLAATSSDLILMMLNEDERSARIQLISDNK